MNRGVFRRAYRSMRLQIKAPFSRLLPQILTARPFQNSPRVWATYISLCASNFSAAEETSIHFAGDLETQNRD